MALNSEIRGLFLHKNKDPERYFPILCGHGSFQHFHHKKPSPDALRLTEGELKAIEKGYTFSLPLEFVMGVLT